MLMDGYLPKKLTSYQLPARNGFTLIETLIYIAITAMILTLAFLTVYQLIDSNDRIFLSGQLIENQRFLLQKITWVLQSADVINSPAAGSSGSSLSVNKLGYPYNPLVVSLSGGVVRLASGATTTPITNSRVTVNTLNFTHRVLSGQIIIEIDAELVNKAATNTLETSILVK